MKVEGTVVGMKGDRALVRVATAKGCGPSCCSCATTALCGGPEVEAVTEQPVEVGWHVLVDLPSSGAALSAVLMFVLPLLGLVGGVLLGEEIGDEGNATGLAIGFGLFVGLFLLAYVVDRKVVKPRQPEPRIVSVLEKGASAAP